MNDILAMTLAAIAPHLLETVSVIVLAVIGTAANALRQRFKIEVDDKLRDALHGAIMNGLMAAIGRGDKSPVEAAVAQAKRSMPDAIKALGGSDTVLRGLAEAMLPTARDVFSRIAR